jgi:hypothetical protein
LEFIRLVVDHVFMTTSSSSSIVLRHAVSSDAPALDRLAALDSKRRSSGTHLVAERDGVLIAALAQPSGATIADPFTPSADAVALLRQWAQPRTVFAPRRAFRRGGRARVALAS